MIRLVIITLLVVHGQCFLVTKHHRKLELQVSTENLDSLANRQPLILTRYLECGEIKEGREAAKVNGILENVESYSGYFTVNKTHGRNLFFWYFPAEEQPADSPVLLWLQGGPGASSMYGLTNENGPIEFGPNGYISLRPHRWTRNHHVIYIDSPAGVGFSFPEPTRPVNEREIGADLYSALEQFFQLFPHLGRNDFFVTGESYGGYYVPSVGYAIHKNNLNGKVKINMRGLMIGNGKIIDNCGWSEYYLNQVGFPPGTFPRDLDNYLDNGNGMDTDVMKRYFNQVNVQEKIHVGEINYNPLNNHVNTMVLMGDESFNVTPIVEDLLQHYRILYYYGQVDTVCPYPSSERDLYELRWPAYSEFNAAERKHWTVDDDLAGYIKSGGNLSLALVRNAGHMVPMDQPVWGLDIIKKFINNELPL